MNAKTVSGARPVAALAAEMSEALGGRAEVLIEDDAWPDVRRRLVGGDEGAGWPADAEWVQIGGLLFSRRGLVAPLPPRRPARRAAR